MAKTYDSYKDSGIAWIGEIPEKWSKDKVFRVFANIGSGTTPKATEDSNFEGEINWIQSGDIYGSIMNSCKNKISQQVLNKYSALKIYKAPFIIVAMYGASVGNISVSMIDGCVNQACCVMSDSVHYFDYLFYAIKSAKDYLIYRAEGGGQPNISQDKLKNLWLPIPPLSEQQSIASFLDTKCGEIDSLISLQEEMISELQAYKQSVITEAVTKGLDPNAKMNCCASREKNDACISSSETQPAIERKFKDSGVEWIGEIPEHWEVRRIKNIGDSKNGLTYSPADVVDENEGTLVLRSSNIQNGRLCFDDNVYVSRQVPNNLWVNKGDIIICSRNGSAALVGKCAMVEDDIKATFGAFMMRFQSVYYHKYIYYLLTCAISQYKQLFSTTTINQLTVGVFDGLAMPFIDDRDEQQQIASYLDAKTSQIDSLISLKQQKIDELKSYKKSIIYEYVTGKKRV